MKILIGCSTDSYFNLAMEEYFLKYKDEDFFMLWQNDKSVIIGKNQNAYAEINSEYILENNIKVVRRITGGGAVFHDLGNVNYTFIKRNSKDFFNDYSEFCNPIINYLKSKGINASLSGRNDMLINDKKFSGNAQCAFGNSVMHHGTLLFSSEKKDISAALNVNPLKIKSKGISSVKSRVTNISDHLDLDMDVDTFISELKTFVFRETKNASEYVITFDDIAAINKLVDEKYSKTEWNYGFKQEFSVSNEAKFGFGLVQININIKNNLINSIKINGDFFGIDDIEKLENVFIGCLYKREAIKELLLKTQLNNYIKGMTHDQLIKLFFA